MNRERFTVRKLVASLTILLWSCVQTANSRAADFQGLGDLSGGAFYSGASGVSADGSVVVGYSNSASGTEAFRWTAGGGMTGLGDLPGGYFDSQAYGLSAGGSVVVGYGHSASGREAFYWAAKTGVMVGLGGLPATSFYSTASGVSTDASVVVGTSNSASSTEAFRWTHSGGMVGLGDLSGGTFYSGASGVSADGSVVVGYSNSASGNEAFRWTASGGMAGLGSLSAASFFSTAYNVSADGSAVVGYSNSASGNEAFRWTASGGMVGLGDLPGGSFVSMAKGVSADGLAVVGLGVDATGPVPFVWDKIRGMQNLQYLLVNEFGLTNLAGWQLTEATAISADGQTIAGSGINPSGNNEAWRANLDGVTRSWTGTTDTSWDEPGNWSKWGKPGPQTTVVINPKNSFAINGPAAEAFVLSLTVGTKQSGVAQLTLDGPYLYVQDNLTVQGRGKLVQNAGCLEGSYLENNGVLSQSLDASLAFSAIQNSGTATFGGSVFVSSSIENRGAMTIQSGAWVGLQGEGGAELRNAGTLTLDSGTIYAGTGDMVINDGSGQMTARGTIHTNFENYGTVNLSGTLEVTDGHWTENIGQISIGPAQSLRTGYLYNYGIINLNGGSIVALMGADAWGEIQNSLGGFIHGHGTISVDRVDSSIGNVGGLIYADGGLLTIDNLNEGNIEGGELRVANGSTMMVMTEFDSSGLITLEGPSARFNGGVIHNTGTIVGCGQVSNTVYNSGIIRAENGQLTLSGAFNTNKFDGQIQVSSGATLFFTQGLYGNDGVIALAGGTLDTNNHDLTNYNYGTLAGYGTVRTRSLVNWGNINVADGATAFYGQVTNNTNVTIIQSATTFYGYVMNNGSIDAENATVRFLGGFDNYGTYSSDPSTQTFKYLTVRQTGALIGGKGDKFIVSGNFLNNSTQNTVWNTDQAELDLSAGVSHLVDVAGADQGRTSGGYTDNFSWGVLSLLAGASLVLEDGNALPGGALYVHELLLAGGLSQIGRITGNGFNLYYDPTDPANGYLLGQTYSLTGGGMLAPVPEPSALVLLGVGALGLALYRWRRIAS